MKKPHNSNATAAVAIAAAAAIGTTITQKILKTEIFQVPTYGFTNSKNHIRSMSQEVEDVKKANRKRRIAT